MNSRPTPAQLKILVEHNQAMILRAWQIVEKWSVYVLLRSDPELVHVAHNLCK